MKIKNRYTKIVLIICLLICFLYIIKTNRDKPNFNKQAYYNGYCHSMLKTCRILSKCNNLTRKDSLIILFESNIERQRDSIYLFSKKE